MKKVHPLIFPVCYPSSSKKSFKTCLCFRLPHINDCAWLKKQSAARGACEGRVTRREILGDFALFLNLTSALLLGLRRRPFSLRLFLLLCQQCHQTRWRREMRDETLKLSPPLQLSSTPLPAVLVASRPTWFMATSKRERRIDCSFWTFCCRVRSKSP